MSTDHGDFGLKGQLTARMHAAGRQIVDFGPTNSEERFDVISDADRNSGARYHAVLVGLRLVTRLTHWTQQDGIAAFALHREE